mgnify:CR=1 FL=1
MTHTDLLRQLVAINSIFPNELPLVEYMETLLQDWDFETVRQETPDPSRPNLLARKGSGKNTILIYGNSDTVPVYGNWKHDPFDLHIEGDLATGLGVGDMKGGLTSVLLAMRDFTPEHYTLVFAFCVDEENISLGSNTLIGHPWLTNLVGAYVPETGLNAVKRENLPFNYMIGRPGRMDIEIIVPGRSAHGSTGEGINALTEAAQIMLALKDQARTEHPVLGTAEWFFSSCSSSSTSLSIPDHAIITINRHMVPPETVESVIQELQMKIHELYDSGVLCSDLSDKLVVQPRYRETPFSEPYLSDTTSQFVKETDAVIHKSYGNVEYYCGTGVADENVLATRLNIPVLAIGPMGGDFHSDKEWVSLEGIQKTRDLYQEIFEHWDEVLRG